MSIVRRCRGSCRNSRRCLEHLWFDVRCVGDRYRMAATEFGAVSRSAVMSSRIAGPIHERPVLRLRPRAKRRSTTPATMDHPDCG